MVLQQFIVVCHFVEDVVEILANILVVEIAVVRFTVLASVDALVVLQDPLPKVRAIATVVDFLVPKQVVMTSVTAYITVLHMLP